MKRNLFQRSLAILLAFCLIFGVMIFGSAVAGSAETVEGSKVVSIDFSKINETNNNLITKKAYPGGTTFSFDAYVPSGGSWWGVLWTTDPAVGDIYSHSSGHIFSTIADQWANYSYTLPDDDNDYYLYFVGECNAVWTGKPVLVDNFTLTDYYDEVIAFDGFNTLPNAGLFRMNTAAVQLLDYNFYASVDADRLESTANATMSLITKEAFPGGSTISFDAFVPSGASWWGVCWTTDPYVNSIYNVFNSNGKNFASQQDQWATYTATLPNDGNNYYIYLGLAVGEWNGEKLLIDNVSITDADRTVIATEGFDNGAGQCIFDYTDVITVESQPTKPVNTYAAINIDNICSDKNHPMSFITKQAYPGGSTVTFDAFVPSGASWWGLCWTTDPNVTSIYNCWSLGTTFSTQADAWTTYTATLPNDGKDYYFYFVGAVGEWGGKELLIDNVVINSRGGDTLAAEDFNNGIGNSIFNFVKTNASDLPVVSEKTDSQPTTADYAAAIAFDQISSTDNSPMSFITKKAYPGGSTVSFDAFIPSNTSWWGICWTTDVKVNSIYNGWSLGKVFSATADEWATYTATLPDDGNDYYFYFVGAVGEWNGKEMLVDNVSVIDKNRYTVGEEDFSSGLSKRMFDADSAVSLVNIAPEDTVDYAVGIYPDFVKEDGGDMSFITKKAYPGGSTVTFDAYIPDNGDKEQWWGFAYSTDPSNASIYDCFYGGTVFTSTVDEWATYTATLPTDADAYYIHLCANKGQWNTDMDQLAIKIDNVVIAKNDSVLAKETFNKGLSASIFNCTETDANENTVVFPVDKANRTDLVYTAGDLNDDGNINVIDLVILKKYLANSRKLNEIGLVAADADRNGAINAGDAVAIKNAVLSVELPVAGGISFAAYAAPTVNFKTEAKNAIALKRAYQKMSEAGFTKAIALYEGFSGETGSDMYDTIQKRSAVTEQQAATALKIAEKYNIDYYVKDWSLYDLGGKACDEHGFDNTLVTSEGQVKTIIENMFTTQNSYVKHPAFAGNFGYDEPFVDDLTMAAYQAKYYYQQMNALGSKGELLINLLPAYVGENSEQLGKQSWWERLTGNTDKTYSSYIDNYINNIAVPYTGYISWDYYPFMESDAEGKANREKNYLANFELIAEKCKNNGVELRTYIQATGDFTKIRPITGEADLSFQIYTGLAFGVREFTYYSYSSNNAYDGHSLFNSATQQYTDVYGYAKAVNNKILKLNDIYAKYKWDAVMAKDVHGNNMLSGLSNAMASHNGLSIASSTGDTLCGAFVANNTAEKNQNAYMFVNLNDLTAGESDTVTVNLPNGTASVAIYRDGVRSVQIVSGSTVSFTLAAGEGVFVIPQK